MSNSMRNLVCIRLLGIAVIFLGAAIIFNINNTKQLQQRVTALEQQSKATAHNESAPVTYILPDATPRRGDIFVSDGDGTLRKVDPKHDLTGDIYAPQRTPQRLAPYVMNKDGVVRTLDPKRASLD